ncbi:hypothetical protein [Halorubrum vacuolatum]|uniref:Uncharacterized protein n=1 Tax=Halorubrum vacuolatum TaxID=63740 RepID=A0A238Y874_HALVU|nr:hypothetical protein [Halorubrum vacuolatum]SNR67210.1 hypothetical protein SAMN06264855_1334 [Halorubrum vacuolatum]
MKSLVSISRRSLLAFIGAAATLRLQGGTLPEQSTTEPDGAHTAAEGQYPATVDRIVNGDHVVLLVEARDEVVTQYDVARTALPMVQEGDRVLVTIADAALTVVRTEAGTWRRIERVQPTSEAW